MKLPFTGAISRKELISFEFFFLAFPFLIADETIFRSRHLLALVAWEQCDFEIGHERNYSFRESWWTPSKAYGWLTLYIICVLIIFVGKEFTNVYYCHFSIVRAD